MKSRPAIGIIALGLVLSQAPAYADGISPVLNFFHRDTWLPASIVTTVIILIEAWLLRRMIRGIRFRGALWRSLVLNTASSITGSVLLMAFDRDSYLAWGFDSFLFFLFLITLATEIPLLPLLFPQNALSWGRAVRLGVILNFVSYTAAIGLQIAMLIGWVTYADHLDARDSTRWNHPELLESASGMIFSTIWKDRKYFFQQFDPRKNSWKTFTDGPSPEPNYWDIEGDVCAFVGPTTGAAGNRTLVIVGLPKFKVLQKIPEKRFSGGQPYSYQANQGITDLAVSPDRAKLAVIFRYGEAAAPRDRTSYYALGGRCRVIVIDIGSGKEIARASRWASDHGVCWLPDSRRVLFVSFDDESLFNRAAGRMRALVSRGVGYGDERFKRSLWAFDVESGAITHFADGYSPSLMVGTGRILARVGTEGELVVLDPSGRVLKRLRIPRLSAGGYRTIVKASPDGRLLLAILKQHNPFNPPGPLTLIDASRPEIRHVIEEYPAAYRFDWTVHP